MPNQPKTGKYAEGHRQRPKLSNDTSSSSGGPPNSRPSGSEYQDVLSGVMQSAKEHEAAQAAASARQRSSKKGNQPLLAGVLVVISAYLWFGQPAFLEPPPPDPLPLALEEAGLRMEMTQLVLRIRTFGTENGRLPANLLETGEESEGVTYERLGGDRFRLVGTTVNHTILYESTEPIDALLADARQVIERGVS